MALRSPTSLLVVFLVVVQVFLEPAALAACPPDPMVDVCQLPICMGCSCANLFPDPEDCHRFYVCTGYGTYLPEAAQCSNGRVFSFTDQGCKEPSEGDVCPPCTQTPPQKCVYECPTEGTSLISSRRYCTEYYECSDGTATLMNCAYPTPYFNGTACQTDGTRCCPCQPSCDEPGTYYIIDPLDCRKYWLCTEPTTTATTEDSGSGKAGPSFNTDTPKSRPDRFYTCPEGEVFNATTQECSATAACVTACINVRNATGCIVGPFLCIIEGFFAKCTHQCAREYYDCPNPNTEYQEPFSCNTDRVFHPELRYCVDRCECERYLSGPYREVEHRRPLLSSSLGGRAQGQGTSCGD